MDEMGKLEHKLHKFRTSGDFPIACVGAVYLDILIDGIELKNGHHVLDFNEEIPVEIESQPGGSAYFVAYYLHQLHLASKIISVIGKDENGDTFWDIAKRQTSPEAINGTIRKDDGKTAVTVHLISPRGETAMYTDRDVLRSLSWSEVTAQLNQHQINDGLIYLAGIFKTNLHRNLAKTINELKNQGGIICIDHGRLHQGQHTDTRRRAIREALPLVDFYFTTRKELSQYLSLVAQKDNLAKQLQNLNIALDKILPEIFEEAEDIFPPVTIIHDKNSKKPQRLVIVRLPNNSFDYTVIPTLTISKRQRSFVGFGNIFQAVFIYNLINSPTQEYQKLIPESAKLAQNCLDWTCAKLGRNISEAVELFKQPSPSETLISNKIEKISKFEFLEITMKERISLDDLHSICLALEIDFEDLSGEAKGRKIVSLLTHLQKTESVNTLINWFKRHRADIDISALEG